MSQIRRNKLLILAAKEKFFRFYFVYVIIILVRDSFSFYILLSSIAAARPIFMNFVIYFNLAIIINIFVQ